MKTTARKSKLDPDVVRQKIIKGMTMKQIADEYGMSRQSVYLCLKNDDKKKAQDGGVQVRYPSDLRLIKDTMVDPKTGFAVAVIGNNKQIVGKMGDEKVSAFIQYHMDMLAMRQGADKRNVPDLYARFARYLQYCQEHGVVPSNMNAYFALGITRDDVWGWKTGNGGTPEHREFATMLAQFFASVHEQGAIDGVLPSINSIFWQKAHDGLIEASKLEVVQNDPLGERKSAEDIAKAYEDVNLPD